MLFNSIEFLIFLPLFFVLYWFVFSRRLWLQNLFVVVASYVFYGWWDWRFLILIAFTSAWAYIFGLFELSERPERGRKLRMVLSCVVNLGILGVFKYYNFFVDSALELLSSLGLLTSTTHATIRIILPVGISFYTFQTLSYTIDVYRRNLTPTRDPLAFFAFISFFPQLVAGPIERATHLLPQFLSPRTFNYARAVDGCRQMLWGFFKKMVVADNCAYAANRLLEALAPDNGGIAKLVGIFCFSIQIYGDFSGYSDIAIGCSRLFGIDIMRNFAFPYFSRDIAEFWRRWHISLTTWFRDYIYIPLGGSRCSGAKALRNTFVIFLVSGLWHGANWTFVVWGLFHALCFLPLILSHKNRKYTGAIAEGRLLPNFVELLQIIGTFLIVMLGWIFFRAPDIATAFDWIMQIVTLKYGFTREGFFGVGNTIDAILWIPVCFLIEWINRDCAHAFARLPKSRILRYIIYSATILIIWICGGAQQTFVYFQF